MLYLNIDSTFNTRQFGIERNMIFDFIPSKDLFEVNSFIKFSKYYTGDDCNRHKSIKNELRKKLLSWELRNTKVFDASSLQFTQQHIIDHFVLQYTSMHTIALNVFKEYDKVTILCPQDINIIRYDWCSPFISLIALLDAAQLSGTEILFIEERTGCLQSAIFDKLEFEVNKVLGISTDYARLISTAACLSKQENIKYAFSNRSSINIIEKFNRYITVQPHELSFGIEKVGVLNFLHHKDCELNEKWMPIIASHPIAKQLEINFFESYFKKIINQLEDFEIIMYESFIKNAHTKNLIVEELTDIYALPLVSAAKRAGISITMFQHSSNAALDNIYYLNGTAKVFLPDEIYAKTNYTYSLYKSLKPTLKVTKLANNHLPTSVIKREDCCDTILIIENDFFRYFGVPQNVNNIISNLVVELNLLSYLGFKKFIWRQRTSTFNPIYEILKRICPDITIVFHCSSDLDDLFQSCFCALGVGSNSSLAIEFIKSGGAYYFIGSRIEDLEYAAMPKSILGDNDLYAVAANVKNIFDDKSRFNDYCSSQLTALNDF